MARAAQVFAGPAPAGSFVACIADEVTREAASRAAAQLGWSDAVVRPGGLAAAAKAIDRKRPPALLLVDLADTADPSAALQGLRDICGSETRFLAIGTINDVSYFRLLIKLGVVDYHVKPVSSEVLIEALARVSQEEAAPAGAPQATRLHTFIGARGGVGTTTLSIATAWLLLHEFKMRAALIDLDLHFGNLALSLDLEPGRGLREALEHPERTDNLLLASAMVKEGGKLPILAAEEPLEDRLHFESEGVTTLFEALAHDHDCLVTDVPRSLDGLSRQTLAAADTVAIVTDLSLAALRDTLRIIELIKALGNLNKPLVIANHVGATHRGEISRAEFERGLGGPLDFVVPFDAKAAVAMAHGGKALPVAANASKATVELRRLAARLAGREVKQPSGWRRWLG